MITLILSAIFTFIVSTEVFANKTPTRVISQDRPKICYAGQCPNPRMTFCFCER